MVSYRIEKVETNVVVDPRLSHDSCEGSLVIDFVLTGVDDVVLRNSDSQNKKYARISSK